MNRREVLIGIGAVAAAPALPSLPLLKTNLPAVIPSLLNQPARILPGMITYTAHYMTDEAPLEFNGYELFVPCNESAQGA
jgi:hypothetical protein